MPPSWPARRPQLDFTLSTQNTATQTLARLQSTASVCVEVLSWDFGAFDPLHEPLASHSAFISPPIAWRACLLKPELVDAVLQVYVRVGACVFCRCVACVCKCVSVRVAPCYVSIPYQHARVVNNKYPRCGRTRRRRSVRTSSGSS